MNLMLPPHLRNLGIGAFSSAPLRGIRAARDFEAGLVTSLLDSLEKSFVQLDQESTVPGADDYRYLGTQALATAIAARGGFGIATMILQHLRAEPDDHPAIRVQAQIR